MKFADEDAALLLPRDKAGGRILISLASPLTADFVVAVVWCGPFKTHRFTELEEFWVRFLREGRIPTEFPQRRLCWVRAVEEILSRPFSVRPFFFRRVPIRQSKKSLLPPAVGPLLRTFFSYPQVDKNHPGESFIVSFAVFFRSAPVSCETSQNMAFGSGGSLACRRKLKRIWPQKE